MSNLFNSTGYAVYEEDMVSGSGCYVFDRKGKKYLDMEAGVWALPLGHCDPDINKAIHNQIDKMMHCGYKYNTEIAEKCARKLLQITEMEGGKCVSIIVFHQPKHLKIFPLATSYCKNADICLGRGQHTCLKDYFSV